VTGGAIPARTARVPREPGVAHQWTTSDPQGRAARVRCDLIMRLPH
jgi:hypothetical protein